MWGESLVAVRQFLLANGMDDQQCQAWLDTLESERIAEIKRIGIKKLLIGSVPLLLPLIGGVVYFSTDLMVMDFFEYGLIAGIFGAWMVIGGVVMIFRARNELGSIGAMEGDAEESIANIF